MRPLLSSLKFGGICAISLWFAWACAPDLDSLSAGYSGGTAGSGVSGTSGSSSGGGGGTSDASGGSGGSGAVGGDLGTAGAEGGMAGDGTENQAGAAGAPPAPPAACDNNAHDANESDVDCGGTSKCPRCDTNLRCGGDKDCASGFCKGSRCAEPTCADDIQNQDETGTDCGGSCAPELGCDLGVACVVNADCTSEFCKDELCTDHCTSGKREADETDKDCGGATCDPCGDDKKCGVAKDCESKICFNNLCQAASCTDNIQNQDESDKDCGGACSPAKACANNAHCNTPADCVSYVCTSSTCVADIDVPAGDVIDDFEDGDMYPKAIGGRVGNWYGYGDGTGTVTAAVSSIPGTRGPNSHLAMHTTGTGFTMWGSGVGVDLDNPGGGQSTKVPYDASAYTGVTFWARAESSLAVTAVFPDAQTDAAGGTCTTCDHHYLKPLQIGTTWQRYTVTFSSLTLEPGGAPPPGPFDAAGIVSVQFRMASGTTYDLWIDDVAFVK